MTLTTTKPELSDNTMLQAVRLLGELIQEDALTEEQLCQLTLRTNMHHTKLDRILNRIGQLSDALSATIGETPGPVNAEEITEHFNALALLELRHGPAAMILPDDLGYLARSRVHLTGGNAMFMPALKDRLLYTAEALVLHGTALSDLVTGVMCVPALENGEFELFVASQPAVQMRHAGADGAAFERLFQAWVQEALEHLELTATVSPLQAEVMASGEPVQGTLLFRPEDTSEPGTPELIAVPITRQVSDLLRAAHRTACSLPTGFTAVSIDLMSTPAFVADPDSAPQTPYSTRLPRELTEHERDELSTGLGALEASVSSYEITVRASVNDTDAPYFPAGTYTWETLEPYLLP